MLRERLLNALGWCRRRYLLGGFMLAIKDSGRQFDDARRDRTLRLLNEALKILDDHADMPEVGARLQGVIDNLAAARPK